GRGKAEPAYQRDLMAFVSCHITRSLINPHVYKAVGIRPKDGYQAALNNPHCRATLLFSGEKIMPFLDEAGLVGAPGMRLWRSAGLLPAKGGRRCRRSSPRPGLGWTSSSGSRARPRR